MSLHHIMHIYMCIRTYYTVCKSPVHVLCTYVCTVQCNAIHIVSVFFEILHTHEWQYVYVHQCTLELRTSASCSQLPAWALSMTLSTISKRSYICMYSHRKTDRESPISASRVSNVAFLSEVQHDLLRVAFTRCCSPPWSR